MSGHFSLILLLGLFGCGTFYVSPHINPELEPYVTSFQQEGIKRGKYVSTEKLNIDFADIQSSKPNVVGLCYLISGKVEIDINWWLIASNAEKENLVYHELGHCLLNRDHCEAPSNSSWYAISIMYPSVLYDAYYAGSREELVDELFNPDPRCK